MKLYKQYLKETLIVENSELADLKKHLHDQKMKYAAAQKRKDKRAMEFWNHAIKNTEEEIKYYENENFSSTSTAVVSGPKEFKGMKNHKAFENYAKQKGFESEGRGYREGPSGGDMFDTIMYVDKNGDHVGYWQNDPKESYGIIFNSAKEFAKHERDEYEKNQKFIDDEIKAGRNPYQDDEDEDHVDNDPIKRIEGMVDINQKKNVVDSIKILAKDFLDEGGELSDVKKYLYFKLGMGSVKSEFHKRWEGLVTIDADKSFLTNAKLIYKEAEDEGYDKDQIDNYMKDLINKSLIK